MKRLVVLAALLLAGSASAASPLAGRRPNIVFILTDDQGYGDISGHGNPVLRTPNLDRLREEGVRFTNFHVSPTCAPTRAALLTGRHEFRNGVTHTIFERERLNLDAITLPQVLKSAGYATGIFGKWHLGDEAEFQPGARGFDETFIHGAGGIGQTYVGSCGDVPGNTYFDPVIRHNGTFEKTRGFCTDVFFAQASRWIGERAKAGAPFYCHIATNAPHSPYTARPEDAALYRDRVPDEAVANFFGMIHNIDENIGRLLARLDELGITRDTLVVFMNDNGGTAGVKIFNAGMRGAKVTPWLGGTRASSFWRWPGTLVPHDTAALCAHLDFFPTLAEFAGAAVDDKVRAQVEGRSLVPLLADADADVVWPERTLITHAGRWPKGADANQFKYNSCAVRRGQWTLVCDAGPNKPAPKKWQLFDVESDPGQQRDVAADRADLVATLDAAYDTWWADVIPATVANEQATGPAINPFKEAYWKQFAGPGPNNVPPGAAIPTEKARGRKN